MMDPNDARQMLKQVYIWLHGYCAAKGDAAPFPPNYFGAFELADDLLDAEHRRNMEAIMKAAHPSPPATASEHHHSNEHENNDEDD